MEGVGVTFSLTGDKNKLRNYLQSCKKCKNLHIVQIFVVFVTFEWTINVITSYYQSLVE